MKSITVNASRTYNVQVGSGLLSKLDLFAAEFKSSCNVAIISDSNVWPIYGKKVEDILTSVGFHLINYVL